jgi:nucleoside-diphosphate-sugar epimerase
VISKVINIPLQKILNPSSKSTVPLTFLEQKLLIADGPPFISLKCQSPTGRSAIDKYTKDMAVDSQLIQRELGFRPEFDLKTGWRETVEEMRGNGK